MLNYSPPGGSYIWGPTILYSVIDVAVTVVRSASAGA